MPALGVNSVGRGLAATPQRPLGWSIRASRWRRPEEATASVLARCVVAGRGRSDLFFVEGRFVESDPKPYRMVRASIKDRTKEATQR